jgi:hypothetical protein
MVRAYFHDGFLTSAVSPEATGTLYLIAATTALFVDE